ncbi:MAG: hypothetical protein RL557_99 [archaeon]|jgi:adenylate cyclase class 2
MDSKNNREIELKFPLLNPTTLIEKLKLIAQSEKGEDVQRDIYYTPFHRNFLDIKPISEWLRLRESKKGFSLNYKKWHNEKGDTISCDEFETSLENTEVLKNIFKRLDFKELITVEKNRIVFNYKDTEIAIDDVQGLGTFIEIESNGNFVSVEETEKHLHSVLMEIGAKVGTQDFEGYPSLLLKKKGMI